MQISLGVGMGNLAPAPWLPGGPKDSAYSPAPIEHEHGSARAMLPASSRIKPGHCTQQHPLGPGSPCREVAAGWVGVFVSVCAPSARFCLLWGFLSPHTLLSTST